MVQKNPACISKRGWVSVVDQRPDGMSRLISRMLTLPLLTALASQTERITAVRSMSRSIPDGPETVLAFVVARSLFLTSKAVMLCRCRRVCRMMTAFGATQLP